MSFFRVQVVHPYDSTDSATALSKSTFIKEIRFQYDR